MNHPQLTLTLDTRLLHHPEALHLRRMRIGIWLYLELLSQLQSGDTLEFFPESTAAKMGLKVGTLRSWLGHLRSAGYVRVRRGDGKLLVTIRGAQAAEPVESPAPVTSPRFFTVRRMQDALGDEGNVEALEATLSRYPDRTIQRALAGALAVPPEQIRKSRTALFLYIIKRYNDENQNLEDPLH